MEVNQKQLIESAAFSVGATVGVMGSRVVANKLTTTLKGGAVRHGLPGIVGVTVAAFASPEDNATKFAQDTDISIAATQLTAAPKVVMTEDDERTMEEGIMKTALGNPKTEVVYVDSTPSPDYYPYKEIGVTTTTQSTVFLSAPSQSVEV